MRRGLSERIECGVWIRRSSVIISTILWWNDGANQKCVYLEC